VDGSPDGATLAMMIVFLVSLKIPERCCELPQISANRCRYFLVVTNRNVSALVCRNSLEDKMDDTSVFS
jgi:hypothetical protein